MSIYSRYKKDPNGFRKLVELLETTTKDKREKMIEIGMKEDAAFTQKALEFVITFQDLLDLEDPLLMEILNKAVPRVIGVAFSKADSATKKKVLCLSPRKNREDIKDLFGEDFGHREVGGAQFKLVSESRELERSGKIVLKPIPVNIVPRK